MSGELRFAEDLAIGRAHRRQCAATTTDEETFRNRVVADIVRVIAELDGLGRMIVARVDELHPLTLPVRDRHQLRVGNEGDPLWLPKPRQAPGVTAALQIE